MPFPDADPLGLIQNWRFENVPGRTGGPRTQFNGTPFRNFNHTWEWTDNVSKVYNSHTFKAGAYLHRSRKDQTAFTSVNGDIYFSRDTSIRATPTGISRMRLSETTSVCEQSNQVLNGSTGDGTSSGTCRTTGG